MLNRSGPSPEVVFCVATWDLYNLGRVGRNGCPFASVQKSAILAWTFQGRQSFEALSRVTDTNALTSLVLGSTAMTTRKTSSNSGETSQVRGPASALAGCFAVGARVGFVGRCGFEKAATNA